MFGRRNRNVVALLAMLLVALAGCNSKAEPVATNYYTLRIVSLDEAAAEVQRDVICTLVGYRANAVVTFTDTQTGVTQLYNFFLKDLKTPVNIRIIRAEEAERIEFMCTMFGFVGDSIDCEVSTPAGRMAPLSGAREFGVIESGLRGRLLPVECGGTIQVQS